MKIQINGQEIKFGYGLYFLGRAQKERKEDLSDLLNSIALNPLADSVDLMWLSAKLEAELDDVELPITKRDFITHLESVNDYKNNKGLIATWTNGFIETIKGNFLPTEEVKEIEVDSEEVKKK